MAVLSVSAVAEVQTSNIAADVNGTVNYAKIDLKGVGDIKINRLLQKPDVVSRVLLPSYCETVQL